MRFVKPKFGKIWKGIPVKNENMVKNPFPGSSPVRWVLTTGNGETVFYEGKPSKQAAKMPPIGWSKGKINPRYYPLHLIEFDKKNILATVRFEFWAPEVCIFLSPLWVKYHPGLGVEKMYRGQYFGIR